MKNNHLVVAELVSIIQKLRGPNGCPWDMKQTPESLKKYLLEEVEELISAIDSADMNNICEEIGDVLYVLFMISDICRDKGSFNIDDCFAGINAKLVRRHPHVFGDVTINSDSELREQWQKIKDEEKKQSI